MSSFGVRKLYRKYFVLVLQHYTIDVKLELISANCHFPTHLSIFQLSALSTYLPLKVSPTLVVLISILDVTRLCWETLCSVITFELSCVLRKPRQSIRNSRSETQTWKLYRKYFVLVLQHYTLDVKWEWISANCHFPTHLSIFQLRALST